MQSPDPLAAHRALVARVDAFERGVRARRAVDMACRAGCSACCHAQLTVCDVEAELVRESLRGLDEPARARLAERVAAMPERAERDPCALLESDGRCAIYEGRPLVCRTQGLPLRYPEGVVPIESVLARARGTGDPLTWCPLNFERAAPRPDDVLDAERVDAMLALSNREHAARTDGADADRRTALVDLAREISDD